VTIANLHGPASIEVPERQAVRGPKGRAEHPVDDKAKTSSADAGASKSDIQTQVRKAKGANSDNGSKKRSIADIRVDVDDGRGVLIDHVYFKRSQYAIYRVGPDILVAHSDDQATADKQIAAIAGLLPLRDHLINLTKDLPLASTKECYATQIADALRLALEQQMDCAKAIINEAVRDALEIQARIGRMVYLKWAAGIALVFAGLLIPLGGFIPDASGVHFLLLAAGAGAVGALLSISIGIRGRSVAIDGNWQANAADAAVRVLIGVISAAILFLVLTSGALTDLQVGTVKFAGASVAWQTVVLVGFVAGFFERLVPDLLEKSAAPRADSTPASNKTGIVSPPGGNSGRT